MQKRVFIVHGWEGSPEDCWIPWLKDELEQKGFAVYVPAMPHPETPTITDWVECLSRAVGEPDGETYFVGYSIGCQAILHYLERLNSPVGGVVCVAGYFRLSPLVAEEEKSITKPWLESAMDYNAIRKNASKIIAIFSDDDPDVDLGNKELFEERLSARTLVEHHKGHFSDDAGVKELPSALAAVLELASEKQTT